MGVRGGGSKDNQWRETDLEQRRRRQRGEQRAHMHLLYKLMSQGRKREVAQGFRCRGC